RGAGPRARGSGEHAAPLAALGARQVRARVGRGIAWVDEARTIRDTHQDRGNFVGVAAWVDAAAREAVVTSELAAGWYRYVPEWRFGVDGTMTALWSFDAVRNWCTCRRHVHHAYFRLDFGFGSGAER